MASSTITQLLEDAELLALYGQRSGKLTDTRLALAIQHAHQAQPSLQWGSDAAVDLQAAFSETIRAIEPVTLVDLHKWNPFDNNAGTSEKRTNLIRVGFVTVAVILMLACGYYTIWYKKATLLLASIASETTDQQNLIINETFFSVIGERTNITDDEIKNPNSISNSSIRQKLLQIQEIERNIRQNIETYMDLRGSLVPSIPITSLLTDYTYAQPPKDATAIAGSFSACRDGVMVTYKAKPVQATSSLFDETRNDENEIKDVAKLKQAVGRIERTYNDIRCILGLQTLTELKAFQRSAQWLKMTTEVLGLWVLPGLYGALGAMMYFMRWFLNQMRPNPGFGRVVLRVSLSTFAGIAVGWFWSPSLNESLAPSEITLGVLALAFLVGFSIDVFFALLDRMVILANSAINRLGPA